MVHDSEQIQLEPTEGVRPPGSAGERLLVGLAALVLGGGVLLAVIGALVGEDQIAQADGSPRASPREADRSPRASRTPRPSPSPRVLVAGPARPPETSAFDYFSGWLRADADLAVRDRPVPDARVVTTLAAGEIARVEQVPAEEGGSGRGWVRVIDPQPNGWIATDAAGVGIELIADGQFIEGTEVASIVSGPEGFTLQAWSSAEAPSGRVLRATSRDGGSWDPVADAFPTPWGPVPLAHGPAGVLALPTIGGQTVSTWSWRSEDGRTWEPLGSLGELYPDRVVGSDRGYVLTTYEQRSGAIWFSSDGATWNEIRDVGVESAGWLQVAATPLGFYAWSANAQQTSPGQAAFSPDGRSWSPVAEGPGGPLLQITSVGPMLLAIDADPQTRLPRIWRGQLGGAHVRWNELDAQARGFEDVVVSALVSDGSRAMAVGWERETEEPIVATTSDGSRWLHADLPDAAFGGIPRMAAAGPTGFVVVGHRPTLHGQNPIVWHEAADGTWAPEADPLFEVTAPPTPDECGPAPDDALELITIDRIRAVACFGDTPFTARVWAMRCSDCHGHYPANTYEPEWLAGGGAEQLFLAPIRTDHWSASAVIHPSVEHELVESGHWVLLTGHFDDPASATCRWRPGLDEERYYPGRQSVINDCRAQFVVTEVAIDEE